MQQSALLDTLWAWLFGQGKSYKTYMINNQRVEQGLKRQDFDVIARSLLDPIVERMANAYDWDFVFDEATESTEVDENEYTLSGNNDDCKNIVNVRFGSGRGKVLEKLNTLITDRREGYDSDITTSFDTGTVYGYTLQGRSDEGFPKIQIFDTPGEVKTLTYRYRRNGLSISEFPADFGYVVLDYMKAQFDPAFLMVAKSSMNELIARYKPGGDEIEHVRRDPVEEAGNIRRTNLGGGC